MRKAATGFSLATEYQREEDGRLWQDQEAGDSGSASPCVATDRRQVGARRGRSRPHERLLHWITRLAVDQSQAGPGSFAPCRLDYQAPERHVPPNPGTPRLTRRVVCIPGGSHTRPDGHEALGQEDRAHSQGSL